MEFPDPIESCPYNIMHRIRRSRMQFHVITCAQNHKHAKMLQCPFDARHVIMPMEFEHHTNTCPARESVLNYALHDTISQKKLKVLPIDVNPVGKWDEKWDDGADVKTYNPIKNIKNKPIVYPLIGVSKSKRKIHRNEERKRYNKVKENNRLNASQNSFHSVSRKTSSKLKPIVEVVHEIGEDPEEKDKPLRPPIKYLAADTIHKTVHKYSRKELKPSGYENLQAFSTGSESDETSHGYSSSASLSSSGQRDYLYEKPSEDYWELVDTSRAVDVTAAKEKNQEKYSSPDSNSVDNHDDGYEFYSCQYDEQEKSSFSDGASRDEYQFNSQEFEYNDYQNCSNPDTVSVILDNNVINKNNYQFEFYGSTDQESDSLSDGVSTISNQDYYSFEPHQYANEEKCPLPDVVSMISSKGNYQSEAYRHKDKKKCSITDAISMITRTDKYLREPYQYREQQKTIIPDNPDACSIVSSLDNYQFEPYRNKNQEKSMVSGAVSIVSSLDNYRFEPYQNKNQENPTIPDEVNVISSKGDYQFDRYQYENQEKSTIPDEVNVVYSKDDYQFEHYQSKNQEKYSACGADSIINSSDDDQFEQYQFKDQEKDLFSDAASVLSNKDDYQYVPQQYNNQVKYLVSGADSVITDKDENEFKLYRYRNEVKYQAYGADSVITDIDDNEFEPYGHRSQGKYFASDADSVITDRDNNEFELYGNRSQGKYFAFGADSVITDRDDNEFEPYSHRNQGKYFVAGTDSVITDKDDYEFEPYQYEAQEKYSISDAVSVMTDKEAYEFEPYQYKYQENYSISDSVTVFSDKDEYQVPLVRSGSEKSLLSLGDEISTIDPEYSYPKDDSVIFVSSKTIEKAAENDTINKFLITDEVYYVSSEDESEYNDTSANWNLDTSLSSETDGNSSFKTAQSGYSSCNTTSTNSPGLGSACEILVQKMEELVMNTNDRGYKKKSESLDHEIDLLKKLPSNERTGTNSNTDNFSTGKLFRKCAANFFNLKS